MFCLKNISKLFILLFITTSCSYHRGEPPSMKMSRYMVSGERLFATHCENCHQKDGQGLRNLYPPLAGTDFISKNFDEVLCIIQNGSPGNMTINEVTYNLPMPPSKLSHLEIAEIATYISNSWGNEMGISEVNTVRKKLENCRK